MKKLLFISSLIFLASSVTVRSAAQTATGSIEGVVVNSVTLQPLSNAQISVRAEDSVPQPGGTGALTIDSISRILLSQSVAREAGAVAQKNVLTDQNGHFSISSIPVGTFIVGALRDGYFGPELHGAIPPGAVTTVKVTAGQTSAISMSLLPGGTISGSILDDRGLPAVDINVLVMLVAYSNGRPTVGNAAARTTDDRGNYRIFGLKPGEYFVAANPKQDIAVRRLANFTLDGAVDAATPSSTSGQPAPVSTFFPNAIDVSQASRVRLHGGEELSGINISLKTAVRGRISGDVRTSIPTSEMAIPSQAGPGGAPVAVTTTLTLLPHDKNAPLDTNSTISISITMGDPANGHFEFPNVLPGVYDLYASMPDIQGYGPAQPPGRAVQPVAYGRTTIDVHGGDQGGVSIEVHHGVAIKGRVTVDGGSSPSMNDVHISLQPDDSAAKLQVYQQVSRFQPVIDSNGSFTIPAVPEAQYRIQVTFSRLGTPAIPAARAETASLATVPLPGSPIEASAYVADILQSGLSVYDNGIFIGAQTVEPLDIRVRTDGGSVVGVVLDGNRRPYAGATVVLVPPVQHRQNPALYKTAIADSSGHFSMAGIRPDEYKLLAWDSIPPDAFMNPDVLSNYKEKETSVIVSANIPIETQLFVIPAR